jgi:hypothetical protein
MRTPEERARDLKAIDDRIEAFWAQVAADLVTLGIAANEPAAPDRLAA